MSNLPAMPKPVVLAAVIFGDVASWPQGLNIRPAVGRTGVTGLPTTNWPAIVTLLDTTTTLVHSDWIGIGGHACLTCTMQLRPVLICTESDIVFRDRCTSFELVDGRMQCVKRTAFVVASHRFQLRCVGSFSLTSIWMHHGSSLMCSVDELTKKVQHVVGNGKTNPKEQAEQDVLDCFLQHDLTSLLITDPSGFWFSSLHSQLMGAIQFRLMCLVHMD